MRDSQGLANSRHRSALKAYRQALATYWKRVSQP